MESRRYKKLISNTGALFALQLANYILPFLIIPFLTRTLGVSLYGVVAFGLAMVQLACVITDFGFNLSATRQIASNQDDREFVRKIIGAVHVCKLFLLLPVLFLILLFLNIQNESYGQYSVFFWFLFISIIGQTFQPIWFFQGIERMVYITLFLVLTRISYIVLTIILVSTPNDYIWVAVANGIAQAIGAIAAISFMIRLGYLPAWPGLQFMKNVFLESVEYFWSRAAVATYTAGGAFFLGVFANPVSVAYYSAAEQLYKGAQAMLQPLAQALYPYMVKRRELETFFKILKLVVLGSIIGIIVGIVTGQWFLTFIFGDDYSQSYPILILFLLAFGVVAPSVLLGYPFLGALGDSKSANRSVIYGGCLQFSMLIALYFMGLIEGTMVAFLVLVVEIFVLVYRVFFSIKLVREIS